MMGGNYLVRQEKIDDTSALKYQLSPYTDIRCLADGCLLLTRRDTGKNVQISGVDRDTSLQILNILKCGASISTIAEWITSGDLKKAQIWTDFLVQNGVLE